jgi:hypothetical protein
LGSSLTGMPVTGGDADGTAVTAKATVVTVPAAAGRRRSRASLSGSRPALIRIPPAAGM